MALEKALTPVSLARIAAIASRMMSDLPRMTRSTFAWRSAMRARREAEGARSPLRRRDTVDASTSSATLLADCAASVCIRIPCVWAIAAISRIG